MRGEARERSPEQWSPSEGRRGSTARAQRSRVTTAMPRDHRRRHRRQRCPPCGGDRPLRTQRTLREHIMRVPCRSRSRCRRHRFVDHLCALSISRSRCRRRRYVGSCRLFCSSGQLTDVAAPGAVDGLLRHDTASGDGADAAAVETSDGGGGGAGTRALDGVYLQYETSMLEVLRGRRGGEEGTRETAAGGGGGDDRGVRQRRLITKSLRVQCDSFLSYRARAGSTLFCSLVDPQTRLSTPWSSR